MQTTRPLISATEPQPCVPVPLDVLDRVVDDLYAVGLLLTRGGRPPGGEVAPEHMIDQAVTRIRRAVLESTTGPARSGAVLAAMVASRREQPDTIELLDAAHAANRVVIDLRVAADA